MSIDYSQYRRSHKKRPLTHRIKKRIVGTFYDREAKPYVQGSIGASQFLSISSLRGNYLGYIDRVQENIKELDRLDSRLSKKNITKKKWKLLVKKKYPDYHSIDSTVKYGKGSGGVYLKGVKNKGRIFNAIGDINSAFKRINPFQSNGKKYSPERVKLNKGIIRKYGKRLLVKSLLSTGVLAGGTYLQTQLLKKHRRRNQKYTLKEFREGVHETNKGIYNTEEFKNELNSLDIIALKKVVDDNRRKKGKKL